MKLPFDPNCEPLFNEPAYKPIDLHPKRLKKYLETSEDMNDVINAGKQHRYKYDPMKDGMELIE